MMTGAGAEEAADVKEPKITAPLARMLKLFGHTASFAGILGWGDGESQIISMEDLQTICKLSIFNGY